MMPPFCYSPGMVQVCACGCGQEFERIAKKGAPRNFIPGHQFRTASSQESYRLGKERQRYAPPSDFKPTGFCACGCGQRTEIVKETNRPRGWYAGYPKPFVHGHNRRGVRGPDNPLFKGKIQNRDGYVLVYAPDHPDAYKSPPSRVGYVLEHRLVCEQKLGRPIKKGEHVHHINGVRDDNRPENLVALSPSEHRKAHSWAPIRDESTHRKRLSEATRRAWAEGRMGKQVKE